MLRQAVRLLLPQGGLCQALSPSQQLLQQPNPWVQQSRSRSDATNKPVQDPSIVNIQLDSESADILEHADALVSVSQAATEAAVLAAKSEVWFGTRSFIDLLVWTHDSFNLPWFEAIAISNLVLKVVMVPFTVITQRDAPRMAAMRTEAERLQKLQTSIAQARSAAEYESRLAQFTAAKADFSKRNKGQVWKTFVMPVIGIGNAAVLVSQFSAVSTLVAHKLPAMTYEGAAWFTDLTVSDPYYILPVICSAVTILMARSSSFTQTMGGAGGEHAEVMRKVTMAVALLFIPMGGYASASLGVLWASNSMFQLLQNTVLANPAVRRALGLSIGGAAPPAGASWLSRLMPSSSSNSSSGGSTGAPPPGTAPTVVKYLPNRPSRRKASAAAASTKV